MTLVINRALLLEIQVHLALSLFHTKAMTKEQALFLFIETKLRPFHSSLQITRQAFREEHLWQPKVERLFTYNEAGLRKLFEKYAKS